MALKALLLDLDGTLIDTAPDMIASLNHVLRSHSEQEVSIKQAANYVSHGAAALLNFGFPYPLDPNHQESLVAEFLEYYRSHVSDLSVPYAGMQECLAFCENQGIPWGVVTNKPFNLSRQLLDDLDLLSRCRILLGGDSLPVKKPDPAPLLHCCMTLSLAGSDCLYVGDHERDITAGNAAGMDTAIAAWGYIQQTEEPNDWGANYLLRQPSGLLALLQERIS